jgi:hypothetical protein
MRHKQLCVPARGNGAGCCLGRRSQHCGRGRKVWRQVLRQLVSTQSWCGCYYSHDFSRLDGLTPHMLDAVTLTWQQTEMLQLLPPLKLAYNMIVSFNVFATLLHGKGPCRACVVPLCAHFHSAAPIKVNARLGVSIPSHAYCILLLLCHTLLDLC